MIKIYLESGAVMTIPIGMLRYLVPLLEEKHEAAQKEATRILREGTCPGRL